GHKSPDVSTTEIYAPFDPSYLSKSTGAIDAFLTEVALQLRYSSISELMLDEIKKLENQGDKWWFGGDLNFSISQRFMVIQEFQCIQSRLWSRL
ncbi:MAG: hypothetical protein AAFV59_09165, partial [Pseudomonadota bacterium]